MRATWEHLTTADVWPNNRLSTWQDLGQKIYGDISVTPHYPNRFCGRLSHISFGSMLLAHVETSAATALGGRAINYQAHSQVENALMISLLLRGQGEIKQGSNSVSLKPGDIFIRSLNEPWEQTCHEDMDHINIRVPFTLFLPDVLDPYRLVGKKFSIENSDVKMVSGIFTSVYQALLENSDEQRGAILSNLVVDGLRLLYSITETETAEKLNSPSMILKRKAIQLIMQNLGDANLSIKQIADDLNVSVRQLQRAFANFGDSPKKFMVNQRLDRAAQILRDSSASNMSILNIAFDVGYNDISAFSRSFSLKYGVPPREYRSSYSGTAD